MGRPPACSGSTPTADVVAEQLGAVLEQLGWAVEANVGQSTFRVPLAVRRPEDERFTLGLLIDDDPHYRQTDLPERYLQRPAVLQAFGWRLVSVFTKDWWHDPERVLRQITRALAGEPEPETTAKEEPPETAVEEPQAPYGEPKEARPAHTPSPPPETKAAVIPEAPMTRRFICTEDGARKFWHITLNDTDVSVSFGRIGTKGQSQSRAFTTSEAARKEHAKLIRSKLAKGYVEESPPGPV